MGIGTQGLELLRIMHEGGFLHGRFAVAELGSQGFAPDIAGARDAIRAMFPILDAMAMDRPPDLYRALGLTRYVAIDLDGHDGALQFDLNRSLRAEYGSFERFDLVTNHGTTEHAFDQARCFENVHDLTRPGGIMVHVLPAQGYQNHGFFNYHPSCFLDLASANDYEVLGLFLGIGDRLIPYRDDFLAEQGILTTEDVDVLAVLRKPTDAPFIMPFDGRYYVGGTDGGFQPRTTSGDTGRLTRNRFPLSAQIPATTLTETRAPQIRFVMPVWGDASIDVFLTFSLPNQMAAGFLDARTAGRAEYIVVTDAEGAETMRAAPLLAKLRRHMRVRLLVARPATSEDTYGQLTRYYNLALADAVPGDDYIFLTADCFISREVLQRSLALLDTHRLVLAPALRVVEESFVTEVLTNGTWDLSGAELLQLAMRHEHPLTEAFTIDNPRGTHHPLPAQVLARLPQGYVGHWTVMHPLALRIANPLHTIRKTIDWNYGLLHLIGWQDVAVLDSLDQGLTISTTPLHFDQGRSYRRGSRPRHHLTNLKTWINMPWALEFHLAQVTHPVRLLMPGSVPELAASEAKVTWVISRFMAHVNSRRHVPRSTFHDLSTTDLLRDAIDRRQWWRRSDRLVERLKARLLGTLKRRLGLPG